MSPTAGHIQYAGSLSAENAAAIVASARGDSGANVDYVANTLQHLRNMRVRDHWLEHVNDLIHRNINDRSTI
jgi:cation transport protein ChaC